MKGKVKAKPVTDLKERVTSRVCLSNNASRGTVGPEKRSGSPTPVDTSAKKARPSGTHASAVALVSTILANPDAYPIPEDDAAARRSLVELAQYARALEEDVAAAGAGPNTGSGSIPNPVSIRAQLEEAAEKIRRAANSGIKKQMTWKPSCKTGTAKWSYDGICPDPEVFGALMGLGGPPTFKMKKFSKEEFEGRIGQCTASVRYDRLCLTSEVNVRWSETGEFKFSGSYGK
ncbi:hypothetical protein AcV5_003305 [Taiwanofungus camphoratus]|nr:hypothetical protein AcV5_003305 [Antrodia cinnamomea]